MRGTGRTSADWSEKYPRKWKQDIPDEYREAVECACDRIKRGCAPGLVFYDVANKYNLDRKIINFYVSQRGGRKKKK